MTERETIEIRQEFTPDEIIEMGKKLAERVNERARIQEEKKEATANFNARIQEESTVITELSQGMTNGYILKQVECEVRRDRETQMRQYWTLDGGEMVREVPFDESDKQVSIDE